jgi:ophiobolin F synthase
VLNGVQQAKRRIRGSGRGLSFPLVQLFERSPDLKNEVLGILRSGRQKNGMLCDNAKTHIVHHLHASGVLSATQEKLQCLEDQLEAEFTRAEEAFGQTNSLLRLIVAKLSVKGS